MTPAHSDLHENVMFFTSEVKVGEISLPSCQAFEVEVKLPDIQYRKFSNVLIITSVFYTVFIF